MMSAGSWSLELTCILGCLSAAEGAGGTPYNSSGRNLDLPI
jgi:hypothetical protein